MRRAWRGQRHDNWAIHANDVLEYYQPAGLGRGKRGVLEWTRKTGKAAGSIKSDLDNATKAVADDLINRATLAEQSSQAVVERRAIEADIAEVTAAVGDVTTEVMEFRAKAGQMTDEYLIAPELDDTLPFAGRNDQVGPRNELYVSDADFGKGLEKLSSSAALAGIARDGFYQIMRPSG
ncbi:hypothetical protein ACFQ1S_18305 [Kibdelosporangium lantanae]|uniref:Uncharacterized protein n=1 Tax=Kibdelosporangium lantanae TaxID=1497396 RepID=A0ABW3M9D6_9PSEU